MKAVKGLVVLAALLALIMLLLFGQLFLFLGRTLLSGEYVSSILKEYEASAIAAARLEKNFGDNEQIPVKELLEGPAGIEWITEQAHILVTGIFSYAVSDAEQLPVVDIRPLKEAMFAYLVDNMAAHGDIEKFGMDRETMEEWLGSELGIESVSDTLDVNVLNEELFGKHSPVDALNELMGFFKDRLFTVMIFAAGLLALIVALACLELRGTFIALACALLMAGTAVLVPCALLYSLLSQPLAQMMPVMANIPEQVPLEAVGNISVYLSRTAAERAAILAGSGVLLTVVAAVTPRGRPRFSRGAGVVVSFLRVLAVCGAVFLMVVVVRDFAVDAGQKIDNMEYAAGNVDAAIESTEFEQVLKKVLNLDIEQFKNIKPPKELMDAELMGESQKGRGK